MNNGSYTIKCLVCEENIKVISLKRGSNFISAICHNHHYTDISCLLTLLSEDKKITSSFCKELIYNKIPLADFIELKWITNYYNTFRHYMSNKKNYIPPEIITEKFNDDYYKSMINRAYYGDFDDDKIITNEGILLPVKYEKAVMSHNINLVRAVTRWILFEQFSGTRKKTVVKSHIDNYKFLKRIDSIKDKELLKAIWGKQYFSLGVNGISTFKNAVLCEFPNLMDDTGE